MTEIMSNEIDFAPKVSNAGSYTMHKVFPTRGPTDLTIDNLSGPETVFEVPNRVLNFGKSFLDFNVAVVDGGASTTHYLKAHVSGLTPIRSIELYLRSGQSLCKLENVDKYTKVVLPFTTSQDDFQTSPPNVVRAPTLKQDSGSLLFPALDANHSLRPFNNLTDKFTTPTTGSGINSIQQYVQATAVSDDAGAGNLKLNCQIELKKMLKHTILGLDRDQYFGEIVLVRIQWNPTSRWVFGGTEQNDFATGYTAYTAGDLQARVSELHMRLALESNPQIANSIMQKVASGWEYLVPFVYERLALRAGGSSQNVEERLNRSHGRSLVRIYTAPFTDVSTGRGAYDHQNLYNKTNDVCEKITSYYTSLNSERLQQDTLVCNDNMPYQYVRDKLEGSCVRSADEFGYNFCHIDDWSGRKFVETELVDKAEMGLSLENEQLWSMSIEKPPTVNLNIYSFIVCQRVLSFREGMISLV